MYLSFCSPRLPAPLLSDVLRIWGTVCGFYFFFIVVVYFPDLNKFSNFFLYGLFLKIFRRAFLDPVFFPG